MAQSILKSKTGKLGVIVVIIMIFIIGLLWINGKRGGKQEEAQEISVPENHEAVTMKIPKAAPAVSVPEAAPQMEEMPSILSEDQEPQDMMADAEMVPDSPVEMPDAAAIPEVSIMEQEKEPEEPEASLPETESDPAPAADGQMIQVASSVPEEEPVAAPPTRSVAKKSAPAPKIRKEEYKEENTVSDQQNTEQEFVLQDIRLSENMKGKVLEVWANGSIQKYKYFILSNPPRLVIDLPGKWKEPDFHIKAVENDLISKVRLWRHDSKLRIVSDLTSDRTLTPVVSPNPDGVEFLLIAE